MLLIFIFLLIITSNLVINISTGPTTITTKSVYHFISITKGGFQN